MKRLRDISFNPKNHNQIEEKNFSVFIFFLASFFLIAVVISVGVIFQRKVIEKNLIDNATIAFDHLLDTGESIGKFELVKARESFENLQNDFQKIEKGLWFLTAEIEKKGIVDAGEKIILAGKSFTNASEHLLELANDIFVLTDILMEKEMDHESKYLSQDAYEVFKFAKNNFESALYDINIARKYFNEIDADSLPKEYRSRFVEIQNLILNYGNALDQIQEYLPGLLKMLGDEKPFKLLVILQNNNEARPTGGFIGSYILAEIDKGKLVDIRVEDVYDLAIPEIEVEVPKQIRGLTVFWRFRDANISPDFSVSAKYLLERFYAEGGDEVDLIIALNQSSLKDFLEITGPIDVEGIGNFTAENYNYLLTYLIESKHSGAADPKLVLKKLVPEFKEKLLDELQLEKIIPVIYKEILYENILAFSAEKDVQGLIELFGADGKIHNAEYEDFLSVSNVSVGGTKTDYLIKEDIYHHTEIKDGEIINMLSINRKHNFDNKALDTWKQALVVIGISDFEDYVFDIMGRGRNRNILNIYVPKGVEILDSNKEFVKFYDEDLELDVISAIVEIWPGEEDSFYVKYKLPFGLEQDSVKSYKLNVEKQPGGVASSFNKIIKADGMENVLIFPDENLSSNPSEIQLRSTLSFDKRIYSVWK